MRWLKRGEALPLFCAAFAVTYLAFSGAGLLVPAPSRSPFLPDDSPTSERFSRFLDTMARARESGRRPGNRDALAPAPHTGAPGTSLQLPRPVRSKLLVSKDHLGGIDARLLVYESWGGFYGLERVLIEDFEKAGWKREWRFEELSASRLPGRFLAFTLGSHRCLVSLERIRQTGKIETLYLYMKKDWLPPASGI